MNDYKEIIIDRLYEVLDYLKSDDYDETCIYHIQMIKNLEECINELKL